MKDEMKTITFITNNTKLAASTTASLHKGRWKIAILFRWIKQNLKIKTFVGTSSSAVMANVWVAMVLYSLLFFVKFRHVLNQRCLTC